MNKNENYVTYRIYYAYKANVRAQLIKMILSFCISYDRES